MGKYILKRVLYSLLSMIAVMLFIMVLIYVVKDRNAIFNQDEVYSKLTDNRKISYKYEKWNEYGYLDYVNYSDFIYERLNQDGVTDSNWRTFYSTIPSRKTDIQSGKTYTVTIPQESGPSITLSGKNEYLVEFNTYYTSKGYSITFLNAKTGNKQDYFAYKDYNLFSRVFSFFTKMFYFENTNDIETSKNLNRYIRWEWDDYANAPALVGSGTTHKYLAFFDNSILFSQQWFHINLGKSNTGEEKGKSIESILTKSQGAEVVRTIPYPKQYETIEEVRKSYGASSFNNYQICETIGDSVRYYDVKSYKTSINVTDLNASFQLLKDGVEVGDAYTSTISHTGQYDFYVGTDGIKTVVTPKTDDIYTATFNYGTLTDSEKERFVDDYTSVSPRLNGKSKIGYSFVFGIIATVGAYIIGLPLGVLMAKRKDKLADKLGNAFIIFMIAVPSLAYIYIFRSIGQLAFKLPGKYDTAGNPQWIYYILPIISLAMPTIAYLMKWIRRYMIDQSNADYVKFARSQGLSESEIFRKHIAKNASIPIIHGIPSSILGCLIGAFYTENVYAIPGSGRLLTQAINASNNGIIVALGFFYGILSILGLIIGDVLMTIVDPRISFTDGRR